MLFEEIFVDESWLCLHRNLFLYRFSFVFLCHAKRPISTLDLICLCLDLWNHLEEGVLRSSHVLDSFPQIAPSVKGSLLVTKPPSNYKGVLAFVDIVATVHKVFWDVLA